MDFYLSMRVLGNDDGLLTIESHAASWGFTGRTQVYTSFKELEKWALELGQLTLRAGQATTFHAGGRDSYSFLGISVSVLDSQGHCLCQVAIESNRTLTFESKNKLELEFLAEPSAVDQFLLGLTTLVQAGQGETKLLGVDHPVIV